MLRIFYIPLIAALLSALLPFIANAQANAVTDKVTIEKAVVLDVESSSTAAIPGTDVTEPSQTIDVRILSGAEAGKEITFENDYIQLSRGDEFYLMHTTNALDNTDFYTVSDPYRLNVLGILAVVFVVLVFLFGGLPGIRGLGSLAGSFILIFYVLIPGILHGYSPVLVATGVAGLIIVVGSYITHGINKTTSAAVLGMMATVLVTGAGAYFTVHAAHLSGYTTEEVATLNFNTHGIIDMVGLLFGGIMIGLLGVLYDIAIGQAVAVEELFRAGTMTRREVYARGIRIGREHIGALVNTLAIAYVGASLPLLLLIQSSTYGPLYAINNEIFATEIIRILIGSIGLVLGVPITTFIASYFLAGLSGKGYTSGEAHHHHHH